MVGFLSLSLNGLVFILEVLSLCSHYNNVCSWLNIFAECIMTLPVCKDTLSVDHCKVAQQMKYHSVDAREK